MSIATKIQQAIFPPFYEPIKCGSLYSEHELTRTITDAFQELVENVKFKDEADKETPMFKQDRSLSNIKLSTQFVQALCGLAAFKAPFKTTPTVIVLMLALIYMVGSLWQAFFDNFVADGLVVSVNDGPLVANSKREPTNLSILASFDRSRKVIRIALAPAKDLRLCMMSATQRFKKFYAASTWRQLIFSLFWTTVTRQRPVATVSTQVTACQIDQVKDDNGGTWEWLSTPSHLRPEEKDAELKDAIKVDSPATRKKNDGDQPLDTSSAGLVLERPIVHYFDTTGLFMRDAAIDDLRNLLKRYYETK